MKETEIYKGYEIYSDPCYYDMIAVRKEGERSFEQTQHVNNTQQARLLIDSYESFKRKEIE